MRSIAASWLIVLLLTTTVSGADKTVSGQFITEPPTLISLGFEWEIAGDENRSAEVAVWYRKKGEQVWKQGLPLLRLQQERINRGPLQYTTPNMFAGSLFELEPGTEYEGRFVLTDPDGVEGRSEQIVTVRARVEPGPFPVDACTTCIPPATTGPGRSRRSPARRLYKPESVDFRLRPGSKAVDAGVRPPNINDDSTGRAPDLGAYESGQPVPQYGPR